MNLKTMIGQTIRNRPTNVPISKLKPPVCQMSVHKVKNASHALGEDIFKLYITLQQCL